MPVEYHRNIAGENYVTRARFGPVGRDLGRRTILVSLDARRRAPIGQGRAADAWTDGYPAGRLKKSVNSRVITRGGDLVGIIEADAMRPGQTTSYALSVHEGSSAHVIVPRSRERLLRFPGRGGVEMFSRGLIHPGTRRPRPFLREALEAVRG